MLPFRTSPSSWTAMSNVLRSNFIRFVADYDRKLRLRTVPHPRFMGVALCEPCRAGMTGGGCRPCTRHPWGVPGL